MKLSRPLITLLLCWPPFAQSYSCSISIVTWNLLAPQYATPCKYPWSRPHDLSWTTRKPRILQRLKEINADIVCLQECQVDLWDDFQSDLQQMGYSGVLQTMGRNHPVANAVLVKQHALKILKTESRSRILIAVIDTATNSNEEPSHHHPLYLACVHLEAGMTPDHDTIRLNQLKSLWKRLHHYIPQHEESPAIVFCGDFNLIRHSPLYRMIQTGNIANNNDRLLMLPLRDAYLECAPPWGINPQMSFRSGHLLDYLWVSNAIDVVRTLPVEDDDDDHDDTVAGPKDWPSPDHPSDHIPLGALLSWRGAPRIPTRNSCPAWQDLSLTVASENDMTP